MTYDFLDLPKIEDFDIVMRQDDFRTRSEPEDWLADAKRHSSKSYAISLSCGQIIPINGNMTVSNVMKMRWLINKAYKFSFPELIKFENKMPGDEQSAYEKIPKEAHDGFRLAAKRYLGIAKSIFDNTSQYKAEDLGSRMVAEGRTLHGMIYSS